MSTVAERFTGDHRHCDALFAQAEESVSLGNWADAEARFQGFRDAMRHHFEMEEKVLFPAFEARTGQTAGPTQVMRMEHMQMQNLLQEIESAIAGRLGDRSLGLFETLMILTQQHNMKEEQMLYPMADRALGEGVAEVLQAVSFEQGS